jgi:hypothetical protein
MLFGITPAYDLLLGIGCTPCNSTGPASNASTNRAAIQESTSLKKLQMEFILVGGSSNLVLENMLTHSQSLRSLRLCCPYSLREDIAVATAMSGLKKEHHITRAHTLLFAGWNDCLSDFDQSARPSSSSKAIFAWVCDRSDWTRDFVAKRQLQNQGIGDP